MKIGILTFHRANNLGAVLQASALQNYIENNISPCEVIDFVPNNEVIYSRFYRKFIHKAKLYITINRKMIKREKSFELYRKRYIRTTKKTYYGDMNMKGAKDVYDVLISGSDQILNMTLSGVSTSYYLNFSDCAKKISYASSFGRKNISLKEEKLIVNELSKFASLSVREKSGQEIIGKLLDRSPVLVVDPVFLLDQNEWLNRCNNDLELPNHYVFVYSMESSELLESVVKSICSEKKMSAIVVLGGGEPGRIIGKECKACGPSEFLRLIKDADYVITNSFHGSAFSIIFKKKFYCIPHSQRNARLENLLQVIGESDKMVRMSCSYQKFEINGGIAQNAMSSLITDSKKYLKENIR